MVKMDNDLYALNKYLEQAEAHIKRVASEYNPDTYNGEFLSYVISFANVLGQLKCDIKKAKRQIVFIRKMIKVEKKFIKNG